MDYEKVFKVFKIFLIFLLICLIFGCSKKVTESFSSGSRTCCSVSDHQNCISCKANKSVKEINDMCKNLIKEDKCTGNNLCVWRVQGGDPLWDDRKLKCKSIIQAGFNMNNFEKKSDTKLKGSSESYSEDKLGPCLKNCDQDKDCKAIRYSSSGGSKKCIIMKGTLSNNNQNRGGKVYKKIKNN